MCARMCVCAQACVRVCVCVRARVKIITVCTNNFRVRLGCTYAFSQPMFYIMLTTLIEEAGHLVMWLHRSLNNMDFFKRYCTMLLMCQAECSVL